jgi:hypothetical protein
MSQEPFCLFYEKNEIDQELICPTCSERYQSPRLLPCGDSICFRCIGFIKDQNSNDLYKCPVCEATHAVLDEKLPRNKILEKLLSKDANEVYRNRDVEELKEKLTKLKLKTKSLEYHLNYPHESIKEYCKSLLDQIDLQTEKVHQLVNEFHDSLFDQVKEYEKECLEYFENLEEAGDEFLEEDTKVIESTIEKSKKFFQEKSDYLRKFKISDEEIKCSLTDSGNNINTVKYLLCSFKTHLFKSFKMQFIENQNELKRDLLGTIKMCPIGVNLTESRTKCFNYSNQLQNHNIVSVHLINKDQMVIISTQGQNLYLYKIDQNGNILITNSIINSRNSVFCVKSAMNDGKLILLARYSYYDGYSSANYRHQILIFDQDLNQINQKMISDVNGIISLSVNDSKYYCLLSSTSNKIILCIYNNDLTEIASQGLAANSKDDPFFFPQDSIELRASNQSLFILRKGFMTLMNEVTGIIEKEYPVVGSSFDLNRNDIFVCHGKVKLTVYDKLGRMRKEVAFPDSFKQASYFFFSHSYVICFNLSSLKINVSELF